MSNRRRIRPPSRRYERHAVVAALVNRATLRESPEESAMLDQLVAGAESGLTARQALNAAQTLALISREYARRLPDDVRLSLDLEIGTSLVGTTVEEFIRQHAPIGGG